MNFWRYRIDLLIIFRDFTAKANMPFRALINEVTGFVSLGLQDARGLIAQRLVKMRFGLLVLLILYRTK